MIVPAPVTALTSTAQSRGSAGTRSSFGTIADAMRSGSPVIAARRIGRSGSLVSHCQNGIEVERAGDDRVGHLVDDVPHLLLAREEVLRLRVLHGFPVVLPGVAVAGRDHHTEPLVQVADERERLAVVVAQRVHGLVQARGEVVPRRRVGGGDERGEMVEPGGAALDRRAEQLREAAPGQLHLVAQPDDRLVEVPPERGADPPFRIREVEEQRVGREALDVTGDAGDERDRAQRVREPTRARVLPEHVLHAVAARDLEVLRPPPVAVDLDRHDHGVRGRAARRPGRSLPAP